MSSGARRKEAVALVSCPVCAGRTRLPLPATSALCRSCRRPLPLAAGGAVLAGAPVSTCVACGDDKLYVQKDLNQGVGCAVLAAGAALVPWTYGLSLGLCALLDFALHRLLPPLTVCYVCGTRYRGLPVHPDHRPFDLLAAQTWEARGINYRRRNAAPDASVDRGSAPP